MCNGHNREQDEYGYIATKEDAARSRERAQQRRQTGVWVKLAPQPGESPEEIARLNPAKERG